MDEMYHLCLRHMNRRVRISTRSGACHEGVIVGLDRNHVFLRPVGNARISGQKGKKKRTKVSKSARISGWGFGFGSGIVALSLFTLLAIALI